MNRGRKPVDMASNLECSSSQDSDVLMIDPFLDYINEILMDEGMDDATQLQQADGTSKYQAIFSSLQDIIHESATDDQFHKRTSAPPSSESLLANVHFQRNSLQESPSMKSSTNNIMDLHENKSTRRSNLHFSADAAARNHRHAIQEESIDGEVAADTMVSCWGKGDAIVEGLKGDQIGQGRDSAMSKLPPSADEQISLNVAELEPSFKDLKLDDVYTSLYVDEPSCSTDIAGGSHKLNAYKKKSMAAGKHRLRCDKNTSEDPLSVDVCEVLIRCAQAVAIGDAKGANKILEELHTVYGASAHGTGLQRMAYIFSRALAARMRGTGVQELEAMSRDAPSSAAVLRASKVEFEVSPSQKIVHYFANQSILKAAEGASRLHIVDYGLMHGLQWPCLINALADRKGGPPLLVITGIEFPQPGIDMAKRLDESGLRLAAYANSHNVPFQYHTIVTDKWEDLDAASLLCSEAEVLVVNCTKRFRHLPDHTTPSASTFSTRQKLLTVWHSLNPHLLITVVLNAALSSPFFLARFRETLYVYSNLFDILDTLWGNLPEKLTLERSFYYRHIMNIVACEGVERVNRPESYKHWHAHITKAGFEQLPIPSTILGRSKSHIKQHYHKDFLIHDDEKGWMLIGWKGRALIAISAWKPRPM